MNKAEIHQAICKELTELYERKNADYGDSFAKARQEIPYYTLSKLFDKMERFKNLTLSGNRKVKDESIEDTLRDLANYCIMELVERQAKKTDDEEIEQLLKEI